MAQLGSKMNAIVLVLKRTDEEDLISTTQAFTTRCRF